MKVVVVGEGRGRSTGVGKFGRVEGSLTLVNPGKEEAATQKQLEEKTRIAAT